MAPHRFYGYRNGKGRYARGTQKHRCSVSEALDLLAFLPPAFPSRTNTPITEVTHITMSTTEPSLPSISKKSPLTPLTAKGLRM
jgi:hypothetical protein